MTIIRINFRITLYDWLEFKRKEQSAFRLRLLSLAESLWFPLAILLVVSVLLLSLTLTRAGGISFPAWPALVIMVLLASCRIYLSVPSINTTRLEKKEWQKRVAHQDCTVKASEDEFVIAVGPSTYRTSWSEVGSVFQSEHLFIFCDEDDEYAVFIPKRAFVSEEQRQEFRELAYQKTVVERTESLTADDTDKIQI